MSQLRSPPSALAVLVLLVLGVNLVGYSVANPYTYTGEVPPDQETYPPVITISSPVNNTVYNTSLVFFTFNVTALQSRTAWGPVVLLSVNYKADWYKEAIVVLNGGGQQQALFSLTFSNLSEGQHSIVVKAVGYGGYKQENDIFYKVFRISSIATISFTVDHTAPTVLVLPPENVSEASTVPLNLTVNEAYSKIAYSLNGQPNVTISGNSTIPHFPAGLYNVTFYVWDVAGNIGNSETANFTVALAPLTQLKPFPIVPVAVASIVSIAVIVVAGLLVYHKKHKAKIPQVASTPP